MIELKYTGSEGVNITMSFDTNEKTWVQCLQEFARFLQATGYVIDICELEEILG